jgi:serine/threonine protein kinase
VKFHNHGRRELKGIGRVEIFELIYDGASPRPMRPQPRESYSRQWTVLPATMGLTEFRDSGLPGSVKQSAAAGRPTTDVVPLRLGNYEIEQRLGSGGMGDVFRARHSQFGRVRAVKVIKQQFVDAGHEEVIRRFYHEIKAVGALEHPNIVVAIDSSAPTDDVHYLVMEYIEGVAADELVARSGPLAIADACEVARQAARGLAYIHQHGMVHRDIKPSNLMLTLTRSDDSGGSAKPQAAVGEQAVVKILDLGLALLVGDDQQRLTVFDNRAMGTAMYMSPEQWKTSSVDIRADIYSLGCTLYHLLAGKPPYWESDLKPEKAHEREELPPIEAVEPIPKPLWDIIRRMTAKNPTGRFANPAEVQSRRLPKGITWWTWCAVPWAGRPARVRMGWRRPKRLSPRARSQTRGCPVARGVGSGRGRSRTRRGERCRRRRWPYLCCSPWWRLAGSRFRQRHGVNRLRRRFRRGSTRCR